MFRAPPPRRDLDSHIGRQAEGQETNQDALIRTQAASFNREDSSRAFQRLNPGWVLNDIDDLRNSIVDRSKASILALNAGIDDLKICDPAVGSGRRPSGHHSVAALGALPASGVTRRDVS